MQTKELVSGFRAQKVGQQNPEASPAHPVQSAALLPANQTCLGGSDTRPVGVTELGKGHRRVKAPDAWLQVTETSG
ncbi:hypothetical protein CapIbe_007919 [Capra ibex]